MFRRVITKLANFVALYFTLIPSITVILSPSLFIMFLPLGILYIQTLPWPLLMYIPNPFKKWSSLYYLNYCWRICFNYPMKMYIVSISYLLIVIGSIIFLWGFIYWIIRGRGSLITMGPYKLCRHPQYLGIIVAALGFTLLTMRPIANISWLIMIYIYILIASLEEHYITRETDEYIRYRRNIPFIIPGVKTIKHIENKKDLVAYTITLIILMMIIIYIAQYRVIVLKGVY